MASARRSAPVNEAVALSSTSPGTVATRNEKKSTAVINAVVTTNDTGLLTVVRQNAEKKELSERTRKTPISTSIAMSTTRQMRCTQVIVTLWKGR